MDATASMSVIFNISDTHCLLVKRGITSAFRDAFAEITVAEICGDDAQPDKITPKKVEGEGRDCTCDHNHLQE